MIEALPCIDSCVLLEVHILNTYIQVTQPYGKYKRSCYTSVTRTIHRILFVGRRTTDMSHVDGVDNGAGYGVYGKSEIGGFGVRGFSNNAQGVIGLSQSFIGVDGYASSGIGVYGRSDSDRGYGVAGGSERGVGVSGGSGSGSGIDGRSNTGIGVNGFSLSGPGVVGYSDSLFGVAGHSVCYIGVAGSSDSGTAVHGYSHNGYAAYLEGKVFIRGPLCMPGGSFKIDHPLDPANKYLHHSFVESPDMKNVYDVVVTLDDQGEAEIELPDWFGTLNKDFRYQLTPIGAPGPNLYIAKEISDGIAR